MERGTEASGEFSPIAKGRVCGFAEVSGDHNVLHGDHDFTSKTP
jgi:acyl dehydratase